jgi:hypothetical protein
MQYNDIFNTPAMYETPIRCNLKSKFDGVVNSEFKYDSESKVVSVMNITLKQHERILQTAELFEAFTSNKNKEKYLAILGDVQGGKTNAGLACMLAYLENHKNAHAVYLVRNLKCDKMQLKARIELFFEDLENATNSMVDIQIACADDAKFSSVFIKNTLEKDVSKRPVQTIFISLVNAIQISKVLKTLENHDEIMTLVDEVDMRYTTGDTAQVKIAYDKLIAKSSLCLGISATMVNMFFTEHNLASTRVFMMPRHDNYKGFETFVRHELITKKAVLPKAKENLLKCDPELMPFIMEQLKKPYLIMEDGTKHPNIILYKGPTQTEHQMKLMLEITKLEMSFDVSVITFNHHGITVWNSNKRLVTINETQGKANSNYRGMTVYNASIQTVITELAKAHKRVIFIIAGNMASRGISFVSSDFKFHLTALYLRQSEKSDASELLQSAGRLCGCRNDNLPVHIYATTEELDDIAKTTSIQTKMIKEAQESELRLEMPKLCAQVEIKKSQIPKRPLAKKPFKLYLVEEEDEDNEFDVEVDEDKCGNICKLDPSKIKCDTISEYFYECAITELRNIGVNKWIKREIVEHNIFKNESDERCKYPYQIYANLSRLEKHKTIRINNDLHKGLLFKKENTNVFMRLNE